MFPTRFKKIFPLSSKSPCPLECPQERGRPVCASDGKLYKSLCTFQKARCRDSSLEVLPRFRCDTNLTRCLEDRAAALSQSRRQMHATYIPECAEDGTFLQVQCHKQTGYCWCSSPEGKPISGTSVLNETPNCTGSRSPLSLPLAACLPAGGLGCCPGHPLSLLREQSVFLALIPSLHIKTYILKENKYPPSCEQERREAIDEARQHQQEGTFIPECEGDGTYKAVQCHQATGYCWCVRVDTGRPVPGTSTRSVWRPSTPTALKSKPPFLSFLPGCPGAKKAEFLSSLIKALASDMLQSRMMPIPYQSLVGPSLEERAVRWQFVRLDKDFSNSISERELRPLKLYMKKNTRPKRCVRKFLDYCDLNENKLISLHELKGCLGLS
uniref:SPARC-related modular calcium-binding protein 1 n=1 Tax=Varanus komodoensis TaxID=61221 RepID=A0A8D2Q5N0_VARKO